MTATKAESKTGLKYKLSQRGDEMQVEGGGTQVSGMSGKHQEEG